MLWTAEEQGGVGAQQYFDLHKVLYTTTAVPDRKLTVKAVKLIITTGKKQDVSYEDHTVGHGLNMDFCFIFINTHLFFMCLCFHHAQSPSPMFFFSPTQVNMSNFDLVMESDLGTFTPEALQFTGSDAARKVRIEKQVTRLSECIYLG